MLDNVYLFGLLSLFLRFAPVFSVAFLFLGLVLFVFFQFFRKSRSIMTFVGATLGIILFLLGLIFGYLYYFPNQQLPQRIGANSRF